VIVASFFDIHSHKMPTKREEKAEEFRKVTKQFLLEHLEEDELDLSMCNLSRVPVKELVSAFGHSNIIHWFSSPACILWRHPFPTSLFMSTCTGTSGKYFKLFLTQAGSVVIIVMSLLEVYVPNSVTNVIKILTPLILKHLGW